MDGRHAVLDGQIGQIEGAGVDGEEGTDGRHHYENIQGYLDSHLGSYLGSYANNYLNNLLNNQKMEQNVFFSQTNLCE